MDQYLKPDSSYSRLHREYKEHNSLVIAYDFDNTVYDCHGEGHTYTQVVELLRKLKAIGCYLIVFTANDDHMFIADYCTKNNIPFDAINENPSFFHSDARKVYYNMLLDDRAGLKQCYETLNRLLQTIKRQS